MIAKLAVERLEVTVLRWAAAKTHSDALVVSIVSYTLRLYSVFIKRKTVRFHIQAAGTAAVPSAGYLLAQQEVPTLRHTKRYCLLEDLMQFVLGSSGIQG